MPVVFYKRRDGEGHFSPMLGIDDGRVMLPYHNAGELTVDNFRRAWRRPGFPGQAVIASRPPNKRLHLSAAAREGPRFA